MSLRTETIKSVLINFRVTQKLADELQALGINISDTCRNALLQEVASRRLDKKLKNLKHKIEAGSQPASQEKK